MLLKIEQSANVVAIRAFGVYGVQVIHMQPGVIAVIPGLAGSGTKFMTSFAFVVVACSKKII